MLKTFYKNISSLSSSFKAISVLSKKNTLSEQQIDFLKSYFLNLEKHPEQNRLLNFSSLCIRLIFPFSKEWNTSLRLINSFGAKIQGFDAIYENFKKWDANPLSFQKKDYTHLRAASFKASLLKEIDFLEKRGIHLQTLKEKAEKVENSLREIKENFNKNHEGVSLVAYDIGLFSEIYKDKKILLFVKWIYQAVFRVKTNHISLAFKENGQLQEVHLWQSNQSTGCYSKGEMPSAHFAFPFYKINPQTFFTEETLNQLDDRKIIDSIFLKKISLLSEDRERYGKIQNPLKWQLYSAFQAGLEFLIPSKSPLNTDKKEPPQMICSAFVYRLIEETLSEVQKEVLSTAGVPLNKKPSGIRNSLFILPEQLENIWSSHMEPSTHTYIA